MIIENIAKSLLYFTIVVLIFNIVLCLYRAVRGPRITDTLLAVNVINVKTIVIICIIALLVGENYIVDVSLVYAIIGFIAVSTFARLIIHRVDELHSKSLPNSKREESEV